MTRTGRGSAPITAIIAYLRKVGEVTERIQSEFGQLPARGMSPKYRVGSDVLCMNQGLLYNAKVRWMAASSSHSDRYLTMAVMQ